MPNERRKIILVENDRRVSAGIETLLERRGFSVIRCDTAVPVVHGRIWTGAAAIVCAVSLPEMDGIEASLQLRRDGCRLPIVLITGLRGLDLTPFDLSLRPYRVVYKPFGVRNLFEALAELGGIGPQLTGIQPR